MKRTLLLVFCIALQTELMSQNLIQNPGFELFSPGPWTGFTCEKSFEGKVLNWFSTHGTGQIAGPAASCTNVVSYRSGQSSAVVWGLSGYSEGIAQNVNFVVGKAYRVSFWVARNLGGDQTLGYYVKAANGLSLGNGSAIPTPTSSYLLHYSSSLSTNFQQVSITFVPTSNYSQLWFYQEAIPSFFGAALAIDDVEVVEIPGITQLSGVGGIVCSSTQFRSLITSSTYTWSNPTGNLTITGSGNTVSVTPNGNGPAQLCLQTSYGTTCLPLYAGVPNLVTKINTAIAPSAYPVTAGTTYSLEATSNSPNPTYNFNDLAGTGDMAISLFPFGNPAMTSLYVQPSSTNGDRTVQITGSNSCGTAIQNITFYLGWGALVAYPNPATDVISIELPSADRPGNVPDQIFLYNGNSMTPVRRISAEEISNAKRFDKNRKFEMGVRDLPRGTYYLHIGYNGNTNHETEKVKVILR